VLAGKRGGGFVWEGELAHALRPFCDGGRGEGGSAGLAPLLARLFPAELRGALERGERARRLAAR
jgi:hypothetical protein